MNFHLKPFGHHGSHHAAWFPFDEVYWAPFKAYLKLALVASGLAVGVFQLVQQYAAGSEFLAALAGVSALLYLGLLIECSSWAQGALNLLAVPLIFALAYISMTGAAAFLAAAFFLHALVASVQMPKMDKLRKSQLFSWVSYNICLALLLL